MSTSRRIDRIKRGDCPNGKCGHSARVHNDAGVCMVCESKMRQREPGEYPCANFDSQK